MSAEEKTTAAAPPFKAVAKLRGENAEPESLSYADKNGKLHEAKFNDGNSLARAVALILALYRRLSAPTLFRVSSKTKPARKPKAAKSSIRTVRGANPIVLILNSHREISKAQFPIHCLGDRAQDNLLRLFRTAKGVAQPALELVVASCSPKEVCIEWDGNVITDSAKLKTLAATIAAKATPPWEIADYTFEANEAEMPSTSLADGVVSDCSPATETPSTSHQKSDAHKMVKRAQELVRDGKPDEGFKLMEQALELARQQKDDSEEVEILCGLALMSSERRHRGDRQRFLDAAEQKVAALKSAVARVIYYRAKASACQASRDLAGAETAYREALRICTTEPDDEKSNLATQVCVVRSSLVHLLCNLKRLDEARPLRDDCESYARANPENEDGELLQAALMASIHFEVTAKNDDEAVLRVRELERLASKSPRLANRVATDLIETANHTSHDKAHRTAHAAAEAAVRIVPLLAKDKQHSFRGWSLVPRSTPG